MAGRRSAGKAPAPRPSSTTTPPPQGTGGAAEGAATPESPRPGLQHLVGIGASAGGLEALQDLVSQLLAGGSIAYVVAQHLSPEHRSLIVDLVARSTGLRVVTAVDGAALEADVIAIAPPNHDVAVDGERLKVTEPIPRFGPSPGIDLLFDSIAEHWGERGIAVVLSGTGSDGARGLRAVRAAGGLTIAQSPESAKFDGMPRAAISLAGPDLILDPRAIGQRLNDLITSGGDWIGRTLVPTEPVLLSTVTGQLRHVTGIDFSLYKESTLRRQLQRRMAIRQTTTIDDYLPLLAADPDEAQALVQNLLVTVTSFFRDPEAFASLHELLGAYLEQRLDPERPLRVWVPGCATGEEVYSIAMVISELLGHPLDLASRLKIFGTDLDDHSLAIARHATYPISSAKAIPDELRRRYVCEGSSEIEIPESLRNCAVFARHNVGEDPPFPRLDLISCRNTLIYFTTPLQDRVLSLFRFGLLPGGLLFLGESESLGSRTPGFAVADAEHRIYRRTQEMSRRTLPPMTLPIQRSPSPFSPAGRIAVLRETVPEQHMALLEALTRAVCPPCLVLDENHDLVEVIGEVSPFCRMPEGRITAAASAFLRPELQSEARALLLLVRADGVAVVSQTLSLADGGGQLRLEARPLSVGQRALTVLSFVSEAAPPTNVPPGVRVAGRDPAFDREIERLERELLTSQNSLRRSLAELEEANEELEASSEELQASSEELQSSNEELEASNEELQATNEELGTLNQQLRSRSEELQLLNNDLENIQTSLSQGMVIVDRDLRVTRFTPLAVRVFALVNADVGQPLIAVPTTLPLPGLREALLAVIQGEPRRTLEASSEEVSYLAQILPYLEQDGRRLGAIVTLTDVSELVALRRAAEASLREFTSLTDALEQAVWKRDGSMRRLLYASKRIQALTGWSPAELCRRPELLDEAIDPGDRPHVLSVRAGPGRGWSVRYRLTTRDGRSRWVVETASIMDEGDEHFVVGTLSDVTEQRAIEEHAKDMSAIFESVFHTDSLGVVVLDEELRVVMANARFCSLVGQDGTGILGIPFRMMLAAPQEQALIKAAATARSDGEGETTLDLTLRDSQGASTEVSAEIRGLPRRIGTAVLRIIVREQPIQVRPPRADSGPSPGRSGPC